jgi:hypothetical protein
MQKWENENLRKPPFVSRPAECKIGARQFGQTTGFTAGVSNQLPGRQQRSYFWTPIDRICHPPDRFIERPSVALQFVRSICWPNHLVNFRTFGTSLPGRSPLLHNVSGTTDLHYLRLSTFVFGKRSLR